VVPQFHRVLLVFCGGVFFGGSPNVSKQIQKILRFLYFSSLSADFVSLL